MKHYIYTIRGTDPDPIGIGDSESWFRYYKWEVQGPVFIPVPGRYPLEPIEGDRIWVNVDENILGCVDVQAVEVINESTPQHRSLELWFDADKKTVFSPSVWGRDVCGSRPYAFVALPHLSICLVERADMIEALCTIQKERLEQQSVVE